MNSRLRLLLTHDDYVNTAQWSSDGTKILTAAEDGTVRVWDAFSGDEIIRITEGTPIMARWSPDERFILAVNEEDLILKVWDTETGLALLTLKKEDIGGALDIINNGWEPWSPSGDRFLLYTENGLIKIFDAQTGKALHTLSGHNSWINQVIWSPRGEMIASSSYEDSTVIVWQAETGEALYTLQGGYENEGVFVGSWSPSGDRFTTHGMGGAKVYEAVTGRQLLTLSVPGVFCYRVIWSPDGAYLLTSHSQDGSARVWDAESGQEVHQMVGLVQARGSDWSPSGDLAAVGCQDGIVRIWEMEAGLEVYKFHGISSGIEVVAFSPDGERILSVGWENSVRVFDLSEALLSISAPIASNVAWSPSGERIANGFWDPIVNVWDSVSGEEIFTLSGHDAALIYVGWSPSGDRILTASDDTTAIIWDATTGERLLTFTGQEDRIWGAAWSPDGSRIATTDVNNGRVIVWDSTTGEILQTFSGHQDWVNAAAWSPDGTRILSTGYYGEAMIWEAATGEVLLDLYPDDFTLNVTSATWTKDGKRVFLQSADGVAVFDSETGEQILQFPTVSLGFYISLSPTEERLLTAGNGGSAVIWDAATGAELLSYDVGGWVWAAYSPDGKQVLVGTDNGNQSALQVFPTWQSTQELIDYANECCVFRELTPEERELFGLPER